MESDAHPGSSVGYQRTSSQWTGLMADVPANVSLPYSRDSRRARTSDAMIDRKAADEIERLLSALPRQPDVGNLLKVEQSFFLSVELYVIRNCHARV